MGSQFGDDNNATFSNIEITTGNTTPVPPGPAYYVDDNDPNTIGNGDGSIGNPFKDLEHGIEQLKNAGAPSTLYVMEGNYGPVNVTGLNGNAANPITIAKYPGEGSVTVDAFHNNQTQLDHAIQFIDSSYVIIDGFNLTDSDPEIDKLAIPSGSPGYLDPGDTSPEGGRSQILAIKDETGTGIKFHESSFMTIQNSDIFHTGNHGVTNSNSGHISVLNNEIHTGIKGLSSYGVYLTGDGNVIRGNTVHHNTGHGLRLGNQRDFTNGLVENNIVYDNGGEAWLHVSTGKKIVGGTGVMIWYPGADNNTIQNNILYYTEDYKSRSSFKRRWCFR